jgi:signal peptidase I
MENTLLVLDRVLSVRIKSNVDAKNIKLGLSIKNVKRGDIVIFSLNGNQSSFFIKRCIGMPGDVFELKNEITFCNNIQIELPNQAKFRYKIWINNGYEFYKLLNLINVPINNQFLDINDYCKEFELTMNQYSAIKNSDFIDSISHVCSVTDTLIRTFPQSNKFHWTIHDFGPVDIPYKGMEIALNEQNITLYGEIIRKYEKENIFFEDVPDLKDQTIINSYIFKQNYYFVMGDNRQLSTDSRSFGFIPENHIRGKAILVLYSYNNRKFHWDRCIKKIE